MSGLTSFIILFIIFPLNFVLIHQNLENPKPQPKKIAYVKKIITPIITSTPTLIPNTSTPVPTAMITLAPTTVPATTLNKDWGVSKQIEGVTYTINVQNDIQMATAQEILDALNSYRKTHGVGILSWDNNLANFAQSRADKFNNEQKLDNHAGFNELFNNPDNVKNLGFLRLGENSSLGFTLSGVHLIEWVYASDAPHNNNQLDSSWTHVGIGVSGSGTDLVFGGN